jgi:hypothetical protein
MAESREAAMRVWRLYWPPEDRLTLPGMVSVDELGQAIQARREELAAGLRPLVIPDDRFMQAAWRQLGEMPPQGEPFDVEAALERFRAGMRRLHEDPAEQARIDRLAEGTDRIIRDLGGEV